MINGPDSLPISALAHLLFCPRRCALIHLEQAWTENVFTAEGRLLHERADKTRLEKRGDLKIASALLLSSTRLGLHGRADVVEFHREGALWRPFPVEYKRGRPRKDLADHVQLCAQAICLEEMLTIDVPRGALFHGKRRRRAEVAFDDALREKTRKTAEALHDLIRNGVTPPPVVADHCESCSLNETCLPGSADSPKRASRYLDGLRGPV